jgi:hypothetical protein
MTQPIAGVAPPQLSEVTIATVWPSIAATSLGQWLGRRYAIDRGLPWLPWLTAGKLIALASIPVVLPLFFWMLRPHASRRYRITNRRILIERGVRGLLERAVDLGGFDRVDIDVRPGQAWYPAGDLVLIEGDREVLRLAGVSRPEGFRQTILKSARAYSPAAGPVAAPAATP